MTSQATDRLDRARTSLLGLSVAEAFGETLLGAPHALARLVTDRTLSTQRPWRWTDDTAMALSIVEVLGRYERIDVEALAAAFVRRWSAEPDRGYGQGAYDMFGRVARGAPWREQAQRMFRGQGSLGNGAAMRATPIGAYFADDLDRVVEEALRSAEPTHRHPDGAAGAVAVAVAAALATRADRPTGRAFIEAVAARTPAGDTRARLDRAAAIDLATAPAAVGDELGTGIYATAPDTVPFCIWVAARHLDAYEEAVWTAATPRGDRDTNAAIVGGIVVMVTGTDAIPAVWREAAEPYPDPLAPA